MFGAKLSICVLTRNQSNECFRLLDSIDLLDDDRIEVIVHDGSDNDLTQNVIAHFRSTLKLTYIHKDRHVDDAYLEMLTQAVGDFVWVIGDDEIIPGSIIKILNVIESNSNLGFIFGNFRIANSSVTHLTDVGNSRLFKNKEEVLSIVKIGISFISTCIFNRLVALEGLEFCKKNVLGRGFINLYFALYVVGKHNVNYMISQPIIICYPYGENEIRRRIGYKDGHIVNDAFRIFGVDFYIISSFCIQFYEKKIFYKFIKYSFSRSWRGVLVGVANGWDTTYGKKIMLIKNFYFIPEAWVALIFFLMPASLIKLGYKIFRILFR